MFKKIVLAVALAGTVQAGTDLFQPYRGKSVSGVDTKTLTGKVMCGYQGWFTCEGDGADLGWVHWGGHKGGIPVPGSMVIDLWPDVSEYDADELYDTGFKYADGTVAHLFSAHSRKTVLRHFEWMREYGIDGAFMQRFAATLKKPENRRHHDACLLYTSDAADE